MARGVRVLVLAGIVVASFLAVAPASLGVPPGQPAPRAQDFIDIEPWFAGDQWTYAVRALLRMPDGTRADVQLALTMTVSGTQGVTVRGASYKVYNTTTAATLTVSGNVNLPTIGTRAFDLSGSASGWLWMDRSDLSIVAANETGSASGFLRLGFPFPDAPIAADGAATLLFLPPEEEFDFPLETGDAWSYDVTVNTTGFLHYRADTPLGTYEDTTALSQDSRNPMSLWFNGTEAVMVPAGVFEAAKVHAVAPDGTPGDRWYNATAKTFVKMEQHVVNAPDDYIHMWLNLTGYSVASPPPWAGTISLDPQRVNPGGWLTASGTAYPDEELVVEIPAVPATYPVHADGSGNWSVRIQAPTHDDNTPANADVGSHGIVVEPAIVPPGWGVATVQLVLPDLYAGPGDLTPSDPAPQAGASVNLSGTVHAGAAVCVCTPFNVSFTVDGLEIQRNAVPGLGAGGSQAFAATWIADPGRHMIAFTADPEGLIAERDETNNTATVLVVVTGPDLAPVNITIESETRRAYPDPAAVGYVSSPVQGRLGGTVNMTFEAADVGPDDVPGPFTVAVVETLGLRGPPAGPRILEATVPSLASGAQAGPWTASWSVPASPGVYHLNVTVDADAQVEEASESNNTFVVVVNVSGPDYRIESVDVPAKVTAGSAHAFAAAVRNDGQLAGDRDVPLAAYADGSLTPFATATVPPIPAGRNTTVSLPWTAPPSAATVSLRFVVDPDGILAEMDEANNDASAVVDVRDPPITGISWTGPSVTADRLYVTSGTQFVLNATDRSGTGLATYRRINGDPPILTAGPFSLAAEGSRTITYWSEDGLGGAEAPHTLTVFVDNSPPESDASAGNRTGDRVTVTLSATDAGVGLAYIEYRVGDGPWMNYAAPFDIAGYGLHNVTLRSADRLGHVEPPHVVPISIQRAPAGQANWKPLLAAAFAGILIALGVLRARREKGWSLTSPRTVGLVFGLAEAATGVLSLACAALAVPPYALGLAVDLAIFLAGLFAVILPRPPRSSPSATAEPEAAPEAATDK